MRLIGVLTVLLTLALAGVARAAPLPTSPEHRNMQLIGHNDLAGFGNGGEGFGQVKTRRGRRILYVAHESGPKCLSVLDVTDARRPRLLRQIDVPDENTRCNSLDVSGHLLVVANQVTDPGLPNAGLRVFDISHPTRPREISFFDTSGPWSRGAHFVWMDDGRYAYLSTGMPDFQPRRPTLDDQIAVIVDLKHPRHPREVGRWWYPGTRVGDAEPLPTPNPDPFDSGCRAHNVDVFANHPDRAYVGYIDCGLVILDTSDKAHPRLVATFDDSPPTPGFSHTLLPIHGGRFIAETHEAVEDNCADFPKPIHIWRNQPETTLEQVATVPFADNVDELCQRGGRFGAHNVYEFERDEPSFPTRNVIFTSWFNGGVRAYDVSNPYGPREVGYYIPAAPPGDVGAVQINDVWVDDRGVIYAVDRFTGGLYTFRSKLTRGRH